jgi:hypothetical protein
MPFEGVILDTDAPFSKKFGLRIKNNVAAWQNARRKQVKGEKDNDKNNTYEPGLFGRIGNNGFQRSRNGGSLRP